MKRFWNALAARFAYVAVTQGEEALRGDAILPSHCDAAEPGSFDDIEQDDPDERPTEATLTFGDGATRIVTADPCMPPMESHGPSESMAVFGSFDTLGITVFSFPIEPTGTGDAVDWYAKAKSMFHDYELDLLGCAVIHNTLEMLVIVKGTREETEQGIISLWSHVEATEFDWAEWRRGLAGAEPVEA